MSDLLKAVLFIILSLTAVYIIFRPALVSALRLLRPR